MTRFRRALDLGALAAGAAVGLAALGAVGVVADRLSSPPVELLLSVAALGLVAAGAVAARLCRRAPLAHAAGAALATVVVIEVVALARRLASDAPLRWWTAVAWLLLAVACGLAGGLATLRAPSLRRRADSRP